MNPLRRAAMVAALAVSVFAAASAHAGTVDSLACKRDLTVASVGVTETMARLKGLAGTVAEDRCAAYRAQFLVIVKARAVFANCKTGPDRDSEVARVDGTIENINGAIAQSCAIH